MFHEQIRYSPPQLESNDRLCFILLVTFTALEANVQHSVSKDKGPRMFLDKPVMGPLGTRPVALTDEDPAGRPIQNFWAAYSARASFV